MEKKNITEEQIKEVLNNILLEEASKVTRQDFSRIQFKLDELQNSLNETLKEFRKVQDGMPNGLKTTANKRLMSISSYLIGAQGNIIKLKEVIRSYKKKLYLQNTPEPAPNTNSDLPPRRLTDKEMVKRYVKRF